jgi:catechol 2,3-dioxygenase-like lactoylglutathione lyase family enzyme
MISGADLDHVALAAETWSSLWPRYARDLSGAWGGGGISPGFNWANAVYANGMRVEVLEPARVEQNDFLRRFLDRNGPGPHHLTFKVPSLGVALEAVIAYGIKPVSVDESNPYWKEAFIHPKDGPGVVVQLAESADSDASDSPDASSLPRPAEWPSSNSEPFALIHVGHAVADMDEGVRFFVGLLGGVVVREGTDLDHRWIDVKWPGPARVRLMSPFRSGPVATWLGARSGRVHHLAFAGQDLETIPDARSDVRDRWVVRPEDNLGTRLVLTRIA